ncbi:MAG: DNA-3-methyladenine glycosylase [Patescibacteria group bacterium]
MKILFKSFYNRPTLKVAQDLLGSFLVVLPSGKSPTTNVCYACGTRTTNAGHTNDGAHANEVVLPSGKKSRSLGTPRPCVAQPASQQGERGRHVNNAVAIKAVKFKIVETEAYVGPDDLASHASRGKTKRNEVMFREPGIIYIYFTYGMHYMLNIVTEKKGYPAAVLIRAVEQLYPISNLHKGRKTNGPAKLTKALEIDKKFNGKPIYIKKYGLWIEDRKEILKSSQVVKAKRIGIDYAGEYKNKLWRFYIKGNDFVSRK